MRTLVENDFKIHLLCCFLFQAMTRDYWKLVGKNCFSWGWSFSGDSNCVVNTELYFYVLGRRMCIRRIVRDFNF